MRYNTIQKNVFALRHFNKAMHTMLKNITNDKADNTDIFPEAIGLLRFLG
jgi:hypothetical protein